MESAALLNKNKHDRANTIEIRLSQDDAILLNNSLHEICYGFGLRPNEFEIRIGAKRENVIELLSKIGSEINKLCPIKTAADETDYLLKSPANARQLERARAEFEAGQGIIVDNLDDLDKLLE